MVCARNTWVLHWLSHTIGYMCYLCIADVCTGYSIDGISGCWKINKGMQHICICTSLNCFTTPKSCVYYYRYCLCLIWQNVLSDHTKKTYLGGVWWNWEENLSFCYFWSLSHKTRYVTSIYNCEFIGRIFSFHPWLSWWHHLLYMLMCCPTKRC